MKTKICFEDGTEYAIFNFINYGIDGYIIEGNSLFFRTVEDAVKGSFFLHYLRTRENKAGRCSFSNFVLPNEMYASNFEWTEYKVPGLIEEYVPSHAA